MLFIHHLIGESSQYLREEAATGIVSSLKIQTQIYLMYSGWEFLYYSNLPPSNSPRFLSQLLSNTHAIPYVRYDPDYAPCSGSADPWSHREPCSEHYALNLRSPRFSSSIPTSKLLPSTQRLRCRQRWPNQWVSVLVPSPHRRLILMVLVIAVVGMQKDTLVEAAPQIPGS